jgi:hypothetical protein
MTPCVLQGAVPASPALSRIIFVRNLHRLFWMIGHAQMSTSAGSRVHSAISFCAANSSLIAGFLLNWNKGSSRRASPWHDVGLRDCTPSTGRRGQFRTILGLSWFMMGSGARRDHVLVLIPDLLQLIPAVLEPTSVKI